MAKTAVNALTIPDLERVRDILQRMDLAPDGAKHDKKCWFCAQCGDDLALAIKLIDKIQREIPFIYQRKE